MLTNNKIVISISAVLFVFCISLFSSLPVNASEKNSVRFLLIPELESTLASRIDALITQIKVKEGQHFKNNQTLVVFDCDILNAQLQKAKIDFEAAQETHAANIELQQFGSVSQVEVAMSSANKKRSKAEVSLQETIVRQCVIKAPFAGRVVKLEANPYEYVSQGDPILEIIDATNLKLRLLLPSKWLTKVKSGTAFKVVIDETGKEYQAKITIIGARINPVNQTIETYGRISGRHPELLAGMSGTAYF